MMDRGQIIETYLVLSRNAQEAEYYWENNTGSEETFEALANNALSYYNYHGITRQELTDHNDAKRNVVKCDNLDEAKQALSNFFS